MNFNINDDHYRFIGMYLFIVLAFIVVLLPFGCTTVKESDNSLYMHRMAVMTERFDSAMHATQLWQQSIYEKQTSLVDSFKHSEVRDTSRTIFLGTKGDTVKETIIIKEYIEREHSSQENTQEYWQELEKRTDSLFAANKTLVSRMDSMLYQREKTTMVEKKAPWYERIMDGIGRFVLFVVAGMLIGVLIRKRLFG